MGIPNKLRRLVAVSSLGLTAVISACASEERSWKNTESTNTVASYEAFLDRYPEGEFAASARERLWALLRAQARDTHTIEAYEAIIGSAPNEQMRAEIHAEAEPLYLEEARTLGTVEAYENFLVRYPEGAFTEEIRKTAQDLRLTKELSHLVAKAEGVMVVRDADSYKCFKAGDISKQDGKKISLKSGAEIAVGTMVKGPPQEFRSMLVSQLQSPPPGGHFLTTRKGNEVVIRGFVGTANKELEISVTEIVY